MSPNQIVPLNCAPSVPARSVMSVAAPLKFDMSRVKMPRAYDPALFADRQKAAKS